MERATHLGHAHHDPSGRWINNPTPDVGEVVRVEVEAPRAQAVSLRFVRDGEAFWHDAEKTSDGSWFFNLPCTQAVVGYRFLVQDDAGDRWLTAAGEINWDPPDMWDFKLLVGRKTPPWVPSTVWYQIFPDRFATSGRHRIENDWAQWCNWDAPISSAYAMTQMYGGDLDGIVEHLDHISDLGISGIYLTPVFPARSNHRYDAASFDHVDPILGGDAALARLSAAAAEREIRVMTDLTLNHTGDQHEWFTAAQADANSVEAGWYHFVNHPDQYESWLNVPSLPKLNHRSNSLRRRLYDGPDSVLAHYLQPPFNMSGWRIDVANMTGRLGMLDLNHEVARIARRTMEEIDPELWLVGEHFHDAIPDTPGNGWHGVMNYGGVSRPIVSWLGKSEQLVSMTPGPGIAARNGVQVAKTMDAVRGGLPWQVTVGSMSLLASHDTARWRSLARTDELSFVGVGMLMMLPGAPTFFYGDEVGLEGTDNETSRAPMPWNSGKWDTRFTDWYRSIIAVRNSHAALSAGGFRWIDVRLDALTFLRETQDERVLIRAARASTPPVALDTDLLGARRLTGILNAQNLTENSSGVISLPGDGPALSAWKVER
ncbi:MAG: glycoside hydrolase family 13 protein [Acidimicrobiales bacterium]|nr:glycoside hydrolase family 13 protein [Acidimicrobiales bacterium]